MPCAGKIAWCQTSRSLRAALAIVTETSQSLPAIEILSPGQTIAQLFDRAGRLCYAGAPLCWIIWPERRKAWLYSSEDLIEAHDVLAAPLPEGTHVSIRLAEIWAELD